MEVCYKCHEEIRDDQKWISDDPEKMFKAAAVGLGAGVNRRNRYPLKASPNNHKYHLECYKKAKTKANWNILWFVLIMLIIMGIFFGIMFGVIIK